MPWGNFPGAYCQARVIYLTLRLKFWLLIKLPRRQSLRYYQGAVRAVVCCHLTYLMISPTHTDGVKPIFTLVTLNNKTHRGFGFSQTILISFVFATPSLAPLAFRYLGLLRCFRGNRSASPWTAYKFDYKSAVPQILLHVRHFFFSGCTCFGSSSAGSTVTRERAW